MEAPEDPQQTNAPTSTQEDAPPMAALLPKLPSAVDSGRYLTSSKIGPQFGPAYGMAPTADVLTPISTMPAAQPEPEEKSSPKWMASSGLAAALLVVAGLAFYYGPFRPTATSATRATSAAANAASSMQTSQTTTTPPVTEPKPVATPVTPATPSTASAPAKSGVKPSAPAATTQTAAVSKTPTPSPAPKAAPQAATPQVVAKATPPPLPTPQPTPVPTTPARTAVPPRAATSGLRHVVLTASSLNWVAVCSDTKAQFSKVLQKGDTIEIDFKRTAVFHIGTAGASRVDVDGKSIGPVGAPGEVKVLEIGEAGAQTLAPGITANARCAQLQAAAKR